VTMNLHDVEIEMIRELLAEHRWSRAGLRVALERFDQQEFDDAFASLVVAGVADADRVEVQASRQLRHLAALGVLTLDAPNGAPDAATLDRVLARQALEAYARRRAEHAGSTEVIGELAPLVDRARSAGLDMDTIRRCIGQPTVEGRV